MTTLAGGATIDSAIVVDAERPSLSVIVAGRLNTPGAPVIAVARKVKTLSPATWSGSTPSSANGCAEAPRMELRSARTMRPVLGGLVPGETVTVRIAGSPE